MNAGCAVKYDGEAGTMRAFPGLSGGRRAAEKSISGAAMLGLAVLAKVLIGANPIWHLGH